MFKPVSVQDKLNAMKNRQTKSVVNLDKKAKKDFLSFLVVDLKDSGFDTYKPEYYLDKRKKNLIDIIPFVITQPWYKKLHTPEGEVLGDDYDIGFFDYKLELPIHSNIGQPQKRQILCRKKAFGEPCYICEQASLMWKSKAVPDTEIRKLNIAWKNWFNVIDLNSDPNKVLVWYVSYVNFEKSARERSNLGEQGVITYAHLSLGKTIEFEGGKKTMKTKEGEKPFLESQAINFLDREEYNPKIIEQTCSFDKFVTILSYEEVRAIFNGEKIDIDKSEVINESNPEEETSYEVQGTKEEDKIPEDQKREIAKTTVVYEEGCPFGHTMGVDFEKYQEDCKELCAEEMWNKCDDERRKLVK